MMMLADQRMEQQEEKQREKKEQKKARKIEGEQKDKIWEKEQARERYDK